MGRLAMSFAERTLTALVLTVLVGGAAVAGWVRGGAPPTTVTAEDLDELSLENWQCHSALTHPVFRMYRQCALLREALSAPAADQPLTILQFNSPTAPPGFWIGAEMRGGNAGNRHFTEFWRDAFFRR